MKSKFFIERPIFSIAIAIMIALVGGISFLNLPVEQFPDIAPPVVEISAGYTGASAEAVQKSVIVPIEQAVNGIDGVDYISSSSTSSGDASISVVFQPGIDPDMATVLVKNAIGEVEGILPEEVIETGVHVEKEQRSFLKVIGLECPDNRYDQLFISNYFDINIAPRLQRIKGVSKIQLLGNTYAMRIWMDPKKMAQFGLEPSDIEEALKGQNIEAAIGTLGEDSKNTFQYTLVYEGRLTTAQQFENIVLKVQNDGEDLRLREVARCELGAESYSSDSWVNSHNGTVAILTQASGSNANQVNQEIDRVLEELRPQLPPGLEFTILLDTNDFLDASMHEIIVTLLEAIILVVLIVLLFLQNLRATFIPAITIIVSLIGTLAFIYVADFSLNLITLFALVLVIGTVVDDAIVVVEAVQSEFERGERSPYKATLNAMSKIGTAVITTTIVFMCVFIPTSFMSGLSGTYYKQFGLTMAVAVAISTLNALTLSPALCALLMKHDDAHEASPSHAASLPRRIGTAFNAAFSTMTEKYLRALQAFTGHRLLPILLTLVTILLFIWAIKSIPSSLIPDEDTGNLFVDITTPPGSTLEQTKKTVHKAADAVRDMEEIESMSSVAGWNILGGDGANTGMLIIKLKHWDERPGSEHRIDEVMEKLEARIDTIKTGSMFVYPLPTVTGYGFSSSIELYVQNFEGQPIEKIKEVTDRFAEALQQREEISEVYCGYDVNFPQYTVSINAAICKRYGIEPAAVLDILNSYVGGEYVSQFNAYGRLYNVMLQSDPQLRADDDDLNNIFAKPEGLNHAPLSSLFSIKKTYGAQSLNRFNLYSAISLEITPEDGYSTGDAIKAIHEEAQKQLPLGYGYEYTGTTREEIKTTGNTTWVYFIVILFIYLVLASLYERPLIPLAVLLSIPFGLLGSCLFALLFELENNIYMQIAIIMLVGLLAKTAILLTEYASERRIQGLSIREAALDAAKARLRPILMTALTLIIGLLPLAFASGAGAMGNISLGLCVIGGMTVGTLAILFFVPLFFMFFQKIEEKHLSRRIKPTAGMLIVLVSLSLGGCKTYSNYKPQQVETDSLVRLDLPQANPTDSVALQGWRNMFTDPSLVALIEEGLANNSDLSIAKLHVDAAKAEMRQATGALFPEVSLNGEGETSKMKETTESTLTFGPEASWEIDIFGKMQNARKAAAASVEEQQAYVQAVQVELIATIAATYYQLEMLDAQMGETRDIIKSWEESIRAQKALMVVGEATSDEISQSESSLLEAEIKLEELQNLMLHTEHALCTLLGRKSRHIQRNDFQSSVQALKSADGIPVQALSTRPDVRQAEAALKAAFYLTNEARAELYPSLTIVGQAGWNYQSDEDGSLSGLLTKAIGSLTMPIFAQGRLRARLKQAKIEQEEANIHFRQTLIEASQEVNDIMADLHYARKATTQNEQRIEKLNHVLQATETRMRYDSDVNFLQVLMARQSLLEARLSLLENRYQQVDASIRLFKALGGQTPSAE